MLLSTSIWNESEGIFAEFVPEETSIKKRNGDAEDIRLASWVGERVKERNDSEIECYIPTHDITLTY